MKSKIFKFSKGMIETRLGDEIRIIPTPKKIGIKATSLGEVIINLDDKPETDSRRDYLIIQKEDHVFVNENLISSDARERFYAILNI